MKDKEKDKFAETVAWVIHNPREAAAMLLYLKEENRAAQQENQLLCNQLMQFISPGGL